MVTEFPERSGLTHYFVTNNPSKNKLSNGQISWYRDYNLIDTRPLQWADREDVVYIDPKFMREYLANSDELAVNENLSSDSLVYKTANNEQFWLSNMAIAHSSKRSRNWLNYWSLCISSHVPDSTNGFWHCVDGRIHFKSSIPYNEGIAAFSAELTKHHLQLDDTLLGELYPDYDFALDTLNLLYAKMLIDLPTKITFKDGMAHIRYTRVSGKSNCAVPLSENFKHLVYIKRVGFKFTFGLQYDSKHITCVFDITENEILGNIELLPPVINDYIAMTIARYEFINRNRPMQYIRMPAAERYSELHTNYYVQSIVTALYVNARSQSPIPLKSHAYRNILTMLKEMESSNGQTKTNT